jgi:hypothetical protein
MRLTRLVDGITGSNRRVHDGGRSGGRASSLAAGGWRLAASGTAARWLV